MEKQRVVEAIERGKLIAIVRGADVDKSLKVAEALYEGGVDLIEFTFDQKNPASFYDNGEMIAAVASAFEGKMLVGAGTVTTPDLVEIAADAGGRFIISPNTDMSVIARTLELGLVSIPGAFTSTEILAAHGAGADFVKVFPAASVGLGYLREVRAPISHVKLLAVGGINLDNVKDFMDTGISGVGVAARLVNKLWVDAGDYGKITDAARQFVSLVR